MMAALPCIEQEINILITEIENIFPGIETYCVNLVGSMSREYTIAKEILKVNCNSKSDSFPKFFKQQKQCG